MWKIFNYMWKRLNKFFGYEEKPNKKEEPDYKNMYAKLSQYLQGYLQIDPESSNVKDLIEQVGIEYRRWGKIERLITNATLIRNRVENTEYENDSRLWRIIFEDNSEDEDEEEQEEEREEEQEEEEEGEEEEGEEGEEEEEAEEGEEEEGEEGMVLNNSDEKLQLKNIKQYIRLITNKDIDSAYGILKADVKDDKSVAIVKKEFYLKMLSLADEHSSIQKKVF